LRSQPREPSMDQIIRIGVDTSKSVFVLHGVNAADEPVLCRKLNAGSIFSE
jgi:transposase